MTPSSNYFMRRFATIVLLDSRLRGNDGALFELRPITTCF